MWDGGERKSSGLGVEVKGARVCGWLSQSRAGDEERGGGVAN